MRKCIIYCPPLIINMTISLICTLARNYGGWLKEVGSIALQFYSNAFIIPIYMLIIISIEIKKYAKKELQLLAVSYLICKISMIYDLLNWYIADSELTSSFGMIYGVEWFANSVILIGGFIVIKIVKNVTSKFILFSLPIIINICMSAVSLLGHFKVWMFGDGLAGYVQIITNAIILPIYILIILHKLWEDKASKNLINFMVSYGVLKISMIYDLLNWRIIGGAMDSVFKLIYGTEWFFNSMILICGIIVMISVKYIRLRGRQ